MTKHFKAIMAGVISGIVAITTACLGISGTVIGSVLASILYQLLSTYAEDTNIEQHKHNIDIDIVYVFPLVIIGMILLVYLMADFIHPFGLIFGKLENFTNNNLFRAMGLGLFLLGLYPLYNSKNISKTQGLTVILGGLLLLLWGLVDLSIPILDVFDNVFYRFDFVIATVIICIIGYVCVSVLTNGITPKPTPKRVYNNDNHSPMEEELLHSHVSRPKTYIKDMPPEFSRKQVNPDHRPVNHEVHNSEFKKDINRSNESLKFYSNKSNRYKR